MRNQWILRVVPVAAVLVVTMLHVTVGAVPAGVPSTPMEAAIDQLRARFPNQLVVGFEELWETRPESEPEVDLGPPEATLQQVLARMRRDNPQYRIDLLAGGLVHIYPAYGTADPPGILDLNLAEFFLPPDDCVPQQFLSMDSPVANFSYTPELSRYIWEHKVAWDRAHGREPEGIVGDFMGDCVPAQHRREPIYRNITLREALNLIAIRSLQAATGKVPRTGLPEFKVKPVSWKYRFRREPDAPTGLGGVPLFQTF